MPFYRNPKPETVDKRKLEYAEKYETEIKWLSSNELALKESFLSDMLRVLKNGSRPFSEKMHNAVLKSMKNPKYDEIAMIERRDKMKPILEKINRVWELVAEVDEGKNDWYLTNYSALPFVDSLKKQFERNYMLSEKQMLALNKVYKKYLKRKDKPRVNVTKVKKKDKND